MEDNEWGNILKAAREMARSGEANVEDQASNDYDNAFTSGTGTDGSYLCVTNHNLINSGSTGSNALTTTLSAAGLNEALILGMNTVGENNIIVQTNFDTLLVGPTLMKTARELMESDKTPESASNAVNTFKGKITKLVVNPYISSTTAYFLLDSSSENRPQFFWRVRPMFRELKDQHSGNSLMQARQRMSNGFATWQGVIGSTGTV